MNFEQTYDSLIRLLGGVPITLGLVSSALAAGIVLAFVLVLARMSSNTAVNRLVRGYVFVFRGTPLLVQLYLIYYGLGQFRGFWETVGIWPIVRNEWFCVPFALALNTAAYTSEILRGGIQSVPFGQIEAAKACGMSKAVTFRRIIIPQAIRQALPAYSNEVILMVKASSLASVVTMLEITGVARRIMSQNYAIVDTFIIAGALYLGINFCVTRLFRAVEWRITPHLRPRRT